MQETLPVEATPSSMFSGLSPLIVVPHAEEVSAYLTTHRDLGSVLIGVCTKLREEFGPAVELSPEMYQDPEDHDRYLVLYVRLPNYQSGILQRIEAVTSEFAEPFEACTGHLLVTTDFRRTRAY